MAENNNVISSASLRQILKDHQFTLKKALGQNFLTDERVLNRIVAAGEIQPEDGVFEIGPGAGVVTQRLAHLARRVIAVEKDTSLDPILHETLSACSNVDVIYGDVLKLDLEQLWHRFVDCRRVIVVANLPYYVTTPILFQILEANIVVSDIIVMVQKEVADRLAASPGTKDYGALTVSVAFRAAVETVTKVHRGAFMPPPNVDSTVIRLRCYTEQPVDVQDARLFRQVVRAAFATRRKTLRNALNHGLSLDKAVISRVLEAAGIHPERRGETLSLEEFASLTNAIGAAKLT